MELVDHIVEFHEYCSKCVNRNFEESEEPCNSCLGEPANIYTKQPVYFKEGKDKIKKGGKN